MMEKGIVEPSSNPWAAVMVLIEKKDGMKRFCLEYRSLNSKIIKDAYPLPLIDDSLDRLQGATLFCTLDQHSGYWQVEMSRRLHGLYQFTAMPLGLCKSQATGLAG